MKTFLTNSAHAAATFIRNGGIVAFPTETVYGLGANVFDERAIERVFMAKTRPNDNPLIAHVGEIEQIAQLVLEISPSAQKFIDAFFPGPLTVVLPKSDRVPMIATANLSTVGVRMPGNELAREFLSLCETPLVAPSANLSGKPSPTTWQAVFEDLDGRIDCILQGETTEIGLESTVVDCTSEIPQILRFGGVTLEQLRNIVPETNVFLQNNETPKSPGMKHRHYSPRAKVVLVPPETRYTSSGKTASIGFEEGVSESEMRKTCESVEDYAHSVFDFFRQCDAAGIETIFCETVEEIGLGQALMDRLKRAAEN